MAGTFHGFGGNPQHAAPESPLEIVSHHGPCLIIGLAGGGHYDPHLFPGHAGPILGDSGGGPRNRSGKGCCDVSFLWISM